MDTTALFITSAIGTAPVVQYLINLVKPYIEKLVPSSSSLHDSTIQVVGLLFAIVGNIIAYYAAAVHHDTTGLFVAIGSAFAGFAIASHNYLQSVQSSARPMNTSVK